MKPANLSLEHLLRPSSMQEGPAPGMFLLHGYGSNEEDLFSFAPALPKELCVISVRAPYPLQPFGYAWYAINFDATKGKWTDIGQAVESRERILTFMQEACDAYNLDSGRINLLGFSQGSVLCYAVAISYPERVQNVVALSGYIEEKTLVDDYREKNHTKLQVYASHGQMDMVIPPEWAQKAPPFLRKLGIACQYEEFPVGHGVSPANFQSLLKWLSGKI